MGGGVVNSHGDHRIAMALSIASIAAGESIKVEDCANIDTSFPGFVDLATKSGLRISTHE